ncbi:aminotransferase class V-fold PLP-dependent enzyme [Flavobacterium sp. MAH-1]|uniref:Aminotransferase class V-fold PLP-dependent enzyme n=1 Tax=Flavobacterium agri TaxID=2743471 RepID=A0A7Y8Y5A0_9FLAO|nr:aminotransferase class V-fold PLP-dependent enzyme [Flavobacterium agri]NUY82617.1 aminotransferase class V-fold PLP-dependent enzyme [Flavobacterium agri]NYA72640.1 aminotransferase class V-fold PLP-dependent enzyme [Flavobacterium agri]
MKTQFLLDPNIIYLNHGSFGACPKPIFDDYQKWQRELEAEPVQFIIYNSPKYLKESKRALANFVNCAPEDFFFTPNPTFAINTIMRSLDLQPGDEILASDNEYGAMDRTWNFFCKKTGAKYVRAEVNLPIVSKKQMIADFWKGYSEKTKVIFLNQISSATALIFPAKEICERAKELGLITIVDGAHVPGHIDLDLQDIKADFYTGTLHKWMLAPKGSSFLYVKKDFQDMLDPLIVSWGYESVAPGESRFLDYQEQQGTRDISAFLTAPACVRFLEEIDWKTRAKEARQLILENYQRFCDLLGTNPICPISEEFLGQMCSIPVNTSKPAELKDMLYGKYRIEIPVMNLNGNIYIRISTHVYVSQADIDALYLALKEVISTTDLIFV